MNLLEALDALENARRIDKPVADRLVDLVPALGRALLADLEATSHSYSCKTCKRLASSSEECADWSGLRIKAGTLRGAALAALRAELGAAK